MRGDKNHSFPHQLHELTQGYLKGECCLKVDTFFVYPTVYMNPAPDAPEIVPVERLKYWDDDGYANLRYFYAQIMKRKGDIPEEITTEEITPAERNWLWFIPAHGQRSLPDRNYRI